MTPKQHKIAIHHIGKKCLINSFRNNSVSFSIATTSSYILDSHDLCFLLDVRENFFKIWISLSFLVYKIEISHSYYCYYFKDVTI